MQLRRPTLSPSPATSSLPLPPATGVRGQSVLASGMASFLSIVSPHPTNLAPASLTLPLPPAADVRDQGQPAPGLHRVVGGEPGGAAGPSWEVAAPLYKALQVRLRKRAADMRVRHVRIRW